VRDPDGNNVEAVCHTPESQLDGGGAEHLGRGGG